MPNKKWVPHSYAVGDSVIYQEKPFFITAVVGVQTQPGRCEPNYIIQSKTGHIFMTTHSQLTYVKRASAKDLQIVAEMSPIEYYEDMTDDDDDDDYDDDDDD